MEIVSTLVGEMNAPEFHDRLHRLEHAGALEWLVLPRAELARRRLRAVTDQGRDIAIALPREVALFDRAVLVLRDDLAVVLRVEAENWLTLRPRDAAAALALGYHAGNLHWRVRFQGDLLEVALEGPTESYVERLLGFLEDGRVVIEDAEDVLEGGTA